MSNALSKAEQNALAVSYDVLGTHVELDLNFVKKYLVRGQAEKVTDQEVVFFMNTCKMQRLNPLVSGECYCIKFGTDPAQMVVGKGAYLRRAYEHPDFLCKEDGIIVLRNNNEVVHKEGCCLYPGETLWGGWCRVFFNRNGKERKAYKEVLLSEYDKGQANWKTKPSMMINKVAISQCVREAFPKDYEGLYSEEEMVASGAIPANYQVVEGTGEVIEIEDKKISQAERQKMFAEIKKIFSGDEANSVLKQLISEEGYSSTAEITTTAYERIMSKISKLAEEKAEDAGVPEDEDAPEIESEE